MNSIRVLGTEWCGDCTRAKAFFAEHHIAYDWVDVDEDQEALAECVELNGGSELCPPSFLKMGAFLLSHQMISSLRNWVCSSPESVGRTKSLYLSPK